MNAREKILSAISTNKPALKQLPVMDLQLVSDYDDLVAKFTATLESIGGKVEPIQNIQAVELLISNEKNEGYFILNAMDADAVLSHGPSATALESVHKAYVNASIGVAENGSVWLSETQMVNRLVPFICQHLVVILERRDIVSTMHHAYQKINVFAEGFGVFVAGPSKTADIEQSLVIGAHGARSLTVYLLN